MDLISETNDEKTLMCKYKALVVRSCIDLIEKNNKNEKMYEKRKTSSTRVN